MKANPNYTLAGGLFLVALTLAAYILCEWLKIQSGPVLTITGPVIAAMFLADKISRVETKTDQAVTNTNGALSGPLEGMRAEVAALRADLATSQAGLTQTLPSDAAASSSSGN